jgi:hypothetical protein
MALEEFEKQPLSKREKNLVQMRSLTNYVMGILLIGAGCVFIFPVAATQNFIDRYDPLVIKMFGGICWIYGAFRIYRGYKKNYFRDQ